MAYSPAELARLIGGQMLGDPHRALVDVNSLELAGPGDLSFVSSARHFRDGERSRAGCMIVPVGYAPAGKSLIWSEQPKLAFVKAMWLFHPEARPGPGVHATASLDPSAVISPDAAIGPFVSVARGAVIGSGVCLGAGCVIGPGVRIGDGTTLHGNVTVYEGVGIGARVLIHAGTVLGADGFGFVLDGQRYLKVPQLGGVVIEDDVEIGANCAVDRATFGATTVKRGTKLDNLVHVAHNVTIGEDTLLIAQVGIAGSATVGRGSTLAGQVGVADNARIGERVVLAGKSGVISGQRIPDGQTCWGVPARPIETVKQQVAALSFLPDLLDQVRSLQARVAELEARTRRTDSR